MWVRPRDRLTLAPNYPHWELCLRFPPLEKILNQSTIATLSSAIDPEDQRQWSSTSHSLPMAVRSLLRLKMSESSVSSWTSGTISHLGMVVEFCAMETGLRMSHIEPSHTRKSHTSHRIENWLWYSMGAEVPGDSVGDEFKGYIFKITGGNDKQGFPMKQGVMHPTRVRLLLSEGHSCYRPRRTGERKRKSVRGCIVAMDLSVLALSIVKQGDADIPGVTDVVHPKRLGPKRATKIRKFFGLTKDDDVSLFSFISPAITLCSLKPVVCLAECLPTRSIVFGL